MAEIPTASEAEAKIQTARSHWKLPRLVTHITICGPALWLRAGEGRLASAGPEAQREMGPQPCGSTGFLGNPWLHSLLAMSVWRSRVHAGPACWVTARPHARFLPMPDAPYFNPLLCYFTQPASICHTAWKNPQVRGDCQRPVRGRLPPFLLPVQQRL